MTRRAKVWEILWPASLCIVAMLFFVQIFRYSGLANRIGELQFNGLDAYYPGMTFLLMIALAMAPVALIFVAVRRQWRKQDENDDGSVEYKLRDYIATISGTIKAFNFVMCAAIVGIVICLLVPTVYDSGGQVARVVDVAAQLHTNGLPARITGHIDSKRIALLSRGIAFVRHDVYVAPLIVDGAGRAAGPQRYFAEIPANDLDSVSGVSMAPATIYLSRSALPPQLVALFRSRGVEVALNPIILFTSRQSRDWPYYVTAIQLLVVALLSAALAMMSQWRRRRLSDQLAGVALPAHRITRH